MEAFGQIVQLPPKASLTLAQNRAMMTAVFTALGFLINALVLRDIFHTLFVPTGTSQLTSLAGRHIWRVYRQLEWRRPTALAVAGPLVMLCIITLWALGLTMGWVFIIWPHLPAAFHVSNGMDADANDGFVHALYLSLVTLGTLGYGDIVPQTTWLRIIIPIEALVGFALGTASISWILSIVPVVARRRHLAREVFLIHRSEGQGGITLADADGHAFGAVLLQLTGQVVSVRNDLAQVPISYYFHTPDPGSALEVALIDLAALAREAQHHPSATVRFQAVLLTQALTDLATHITEAFLDHAPSELDTMLRAYATDHAHPADRSSRQATVRSDLHAES